MDHHFLLTLAVVLGLTAPARAVLAAPADSTDLGDASEATAAYFETGTIGHFPSCIAPSDPGTQGVTCAPISTSPGFTGYMKHVPSTRRPPYWLGCGSPGIDFESDAKNAPIVPAEASCGDAPGDCVENASFFDMTRSQQQDECPGDGVDAGVDAFVGFSGSNSCPTNTLECSAFNSGPPCVVYLNVVVDFNEDGDWNDNARCTYVAGCAYEWAVKNQAVQLDHGCNTLVSSPFLISWEGVPFGFPSWTRITLTDDPVDDDFPWKGSAGRPNDAYEGGETEDYLLAVFYPDAVTPSSWGEVKIRYGR